MTSVTGVQRLNTPRCIDCLAEGITTNRPIVDGVRKPRCATHKRAAKKRARINAHGRRVEVTYGVPQELYWALYEAQGGKCALCQVATGKARRLAVDHDHKKAVEACGHDADKGCPSCVRGLLCSPCNVMIGRYGIEALTRTINYLYDPPAREVIEQFLTAGRELDL